MKRTASALLLLLFAAACQKSGPATPAPQASPDAAAPAPKAAPDAAAPADPFAALVADPDRTDEDRADDAGRKPAECLRFMGVAPGMRVADLAAGSGYLTELLVRAVGPTGKVYAQNSKMVIEKFVSESWPKRLARPVNAGVVRVDREFDAPLPPDATDLDLVTLGFFYHDTYWMKLDRAKLDAAVFAALKPGGRYVIFDHAAAAGRGAQDAEKLHRVEKATVIADVSKAGFVLEKEGDFLANPDDPHTETVFGSLRGKTDRFALVFQKPAAPK